jgi:hypothetical protein
LLLQTLRDVAAGKEPQGLDPESYRIRSTRFALPRGDKFEEEIARQLAEPESLDFTKLRAPKRSAANYQLAPGER